MSILRGRCGWITPLRVIRTLTDVALQALSGDSAVRHSGMGRRSIPPEQLLRAMLLQAFYSIRSARLLRDRLEYDMLFKWFVGLGVDDAGWDHSTLSKNRHRLLGGVIAAETAMPFCAPRVKRLLSSERCSVDGTLIEAWASLKNFKPKEPPDGGSTSRGRSGRTRPIAAPPTRMACSIARGRAWTRRYASSGTG